MIAVIAAHRDGKAIEWRFIEGGFQYDALNELKWRQVSGSGELHYFNFAICEYRIKPEPQKPREWWISECPHDQGTKMVFETPAIPCSNPDCKIIHVIEVLPSSGEKGAT